jgi:hypothetical protein
MDIHPVHLMSSVKRRAHLFGFKGHFIPAGLTDQLQHFDRMAFGGLKGTARSLSIKFVHDEPGARMAKQSAVQVP